MMLFATAPELSVSRRPMRAAILLTLLVSAFSLALGQDQAGVGQAQHVLRGQVALGLDGGCHVGRALTCG